MQRCCCVSLWALAVLSMWHSYIPAGLFHCKACVTRTSLLFSGCTDTAVELAIKADPQHWHFVLDAPCSSTYWGCMAPSSGLKLHLRFLWPQPPQLISLQYDSWAEQSLTLCWNITVFQQRLSSQDIWPLLAPPRNPNSTSKPQLPCEVTVYSSPSWRLWDSRTDIWTVYDDIMSAVVTGVCEVAVWNWNESKCTLKHIWPVISDL